MATKKTKTIKKEVRDAIVTQALSEIEFARRHKEGKISNWHKNEGMYYGKKEKGEDSRANVDLARMQEHVHTLLSKIDSPLTFKFGKKKKAQLKRAERINSLKDYDSDRDNWDIKDIAGKKQCIIYGRSVFSYSAESMDGYKPNLENIDIYNFLIDPAAGGLDVEDARYLGNYGVVKDASELKDNKNYLQTEVKELLAGNGNSSESSQEKQNARNRSYGSSNQSEDKENADTDKYTFWQWGTTYKGKRYYLLLNETGGRAIRVVELEDLFTSGLWWYWSYAGFPDLTEFWTPSHCDYVRELFMAQAVSINQMIDNAEQINKPQRVVDVTAIQSLAELRYKKNGWIKAKGGQAKNAIEILSTPSIQTPIEVFNVLEGIQQQSSGLTAGTKGVEDTDGRATIYEGNQAAAADRFGLFNKSYSFGYKGFARLYEWGVRDHLTGKMAVDILGPDGVDIQMISKRDIFRKDEDFAYIIESSNSELALSEQKKRSQTAFFSALLNHPLIDQKDLIMELGTTTGVEVGTMRRLLDNSEFGDEEILSEADRDIEIIIDGTLPKPNRVANSAYLQYFVDYMQDHEEDIDSETFARMVQYMEGLQEVVVRNTIEKARRVAAAEQAVQAAGQNGADGGTPVRAPGPAQPLADVIQQNVQ
jgi:hypothetical protein